MGKPMAIDVQELWDRDLGDLVAVREYQDGALVGEVAVVELVFQRGVARISVDPNTDEVVLLGEDQWSRGTWELLPEHEVWAEVVGCRAAWIWCVCNQQGYHDAIQLELWKEEHHCKLQLLGIGSRLERYVLRDLDPGRGERLRIRDVGGAVLLAVDGPTLAGRDLRGVDLHKAVMSGIDARAAVFDRGRLVGTYLSGANLAECTLREVVMVNAVLDGACCVGADFGRVVARCTSLRGAWLQHTRWDDADVTSADFSGADLRGADLGFASFDLARFAGALYDEATRWPAVLDPTSVGAVAEHDRRQPHAR